MYPSNLIHLLVKKLSINQYRLLLLYVVNSDSMVQFQQEDCIELSQSFINNPRILQSAAFLQSNPKIKFSIGTWLIGRTNISVQLASSLFGSRVADVSVLKDYAYICNYIKMYEPEVMVSIKTDIIKFYNYGIDAELRPLFIKLLANFCCGEIPEEWQEILLLNWREGRRDLAQASLKSLIKCKLQPDFFDDLEPFERIDNLEILTDVLVASKNENIFALLRDRICVASECSIRKRSKPKNIKTEILPHRHIQNE